MKRWISMILMIALMAGSGYAEELQDSDILFDLPFFTSADQALSYERFIEEPTYDPEYPRVDGFIEVLDRIAYLIISLPSTENAVTATSLTFMTSFEDVSVLYEDLLDMCVNKWGLPDISHAMSIRSDDTSAEWIYEEMGESISVEQVLKGEIETPVCYEYVWNPNKQHEYKMTIFEMFRGVQTITIGMSYILN